jgi:RNA polymerase sigma-70 factor (ECF subfamily)
MNTAALGCDIEDALRQVREGSVDAYETVILAYQSRLRFIIADISPPGIEPDEIAHLAFVEAFRRIDHYTPHTQFFAWLSAIARHLVLGAIRKMRREARGIENYLEQAVGQALETELEAVTELEELRVNALRGCVAGLSDRLREVLRLRYDRGTPIERIARNVGKSTGAVKVLLFEIRRKLRGCVNRKLAAERG